MVVNLTSPGIQTREIDISTVIPSVSTLEGAIAGVFRWGPVDEPILISSEVELENTFGAPGINYNQETFFTAADFLAYSNALYVVRVSDANTATGDSNTDVGVIDAKYPGALGNSIRVEIYNSVNANTATFDGVTQTTPEDASHFNVVVVDSAGTITGIADTVLEIFENISSVVGEKTEDGSNNYMPTVINDRSSYIKFDTAILTDLTAFAALDITLAGGDDGSTETTIALGDLQAGYDKYDTVENIDISLVLQGKARGGSTPEAELGQYIIANIAESRKDCVAFVSPNRAAVVNNIGSEVADILIFRNAITNSSYGVMDSGYKYRYDKYNDSYVYTPLNGDIAGLCVRTDAQRDPWFSPAGYNRGLIKNVVKLAWNPTKTSRDQLYKADVNPVITQVGEGTLLFGDKTMLGRASAFSRINVRRLFIILQRSVSSASRSTLFEFNDTFTRTQFKNTVEPFLREIQGRRGITDFRVVCDETNNPNAVVDSNEFVGDIYVKPARSINFIRLNFVAVRSGVEFSEIVGQF
jgi:hypothetical protein